MTGFSMPTLYVGTGSQPISALRSHRPDVTHSLPIIGVPGTGGIESCDFHRRMYFLSLGHQKLFVVLAPKQASESLPYAELMGVIKDGFGRTMKRLPEVFGVSRQTLYNWWNGETPKPVHHEKLQQLAEAARTFRALGFKPTSLALDRKVSQGKSLLQLLGEGADGADSAKKLVRIIHRGNEARSKLNDLLGGRKADLSAVSIGAPSSDEDA